MPGFDDACSLHNPLSAQLQRASEMSFPPLLFCSGVSPEDSDPIIDEFLEKRSFEKPERVETS